MNKAEEISEILAARFVRADPQWNRHLEHGGVIVSGYEVRLAYSTGNGGGTRPGACVWFRPSQKMAEDPQFGRVRDEHLAKYARALHENGYDVRIVGVHLEVGEI